MKLVRLAIVTVPDLVKIDTLPLPLTTGEVDLRNFFVKSEKEKHRLVLIALADVTLQIRVDDENRVVIPEEKLSLCHQFIEVFANLISISNCCDRSISSPHPAVALIPESVDESTLLKSSAGIKAAWKHTVRGDCRFDLQNLDLSNVSDRLDGLALLAEFHNHRHPTGKFHELMRLFERAFASSGAGLYKPILHFLSTSSLHFLKDEVMPWTKTVRHPATHADRLTEIFLEQDIAPYIPRMELAAYDVLLNKHHWHSVDPDRRKVWLPASGPSGTGPDIFVTRGKELRIEMRQLDPLGVYSMDLQGVLTSHPGDWYVQLSQSNNGRVDASHQV